MFEYCHSAPLNYIDPSGEQIRPFQGPPWSPYPYPSSPLPPVTTPPAWTPNPGDPERYAMSVCWAECCQLRALGTTGIWGASAVGGRVATDAQEWADAYFPRLTRANSALRHCAVSGMLASRFGCACSQCIVDMRDVGQWYMSVQSWANTIQALYNDREGRDCAGCSGKGGTEGPTFYFNSDAKIKKCCLNKFTTKRLFTGSPFTGIPGFPLFPTVFPRNPRKNWWYPENQPQIEW